MLDTFLSVWVWFTEAAPGPLWHLMVMGASLGAFQVVMRLPTLPLRRMTAEHVRTTERLRPQLDERLSDDLVGEARPRVVMEFWQEHGVNPLTGLLSSMAQLLVLVPLIGLNFAVFITQWLLIDRAPVEAIDRLSLVASGRWELLGVMAVTYAVVRALNVMITHDTAKKRVRPYLIAVSVGLAGTALLPFAIVVVIWAQRTVSGLLDIVLELDASGRRRRRAAGEAQSTV